MNSRNFDFVIVGFPKCGTSALIRRLNNHEGVNIGRSIDGSLEVDITSLGAHELPNAFYREGMVNGHKNVAYIYSKHRLKELVEINPDALFICCVRDPVKSLVSWHNMHRKIASSGNRPGHFAYKERDFYSTCTIDSYYYEFAREKLKYHIYLSRLIATVNSRNIIVVSQEFMAQNMGHVASACMERFGIPVLSDADEPACDHRGYADLNEISISNEIGSELDEVKMESYRVAKEAGILHLV